MVSWFPLIGLKPENRNTIWLVPTGMLLWTLPELLITHWLVPGSPIDVQYQLATEIIQVTTLWIPMMAVVRIILALVYVTLYRRFYSKLPVSLRTETKELVWRDLYWPALLCVVSVVIGLILII
ncbi:MAG: hypothetical protein PHQ86_08960 [Dehalococcoidales bacterium]|nr:hypothetical protein [Dehalococcoidales bacterium]